jgi:hypothetical protein
MNGTDASLENILAFQDREKDYQKMKGGMKEMD